MRESSVVLAAASSVQTLVHQRIEFCFTHPLSSSMVEEPISAQIRAVANSCKYKYKNIFFRGS